MKIRNSQYERGYSLMAFNPRSLLKLSGGASELCLCRWTDGRTDGDVITFSRIDGFPFVVTHGAPRAAIITWTRL